MGESGTEIRRVQVEPRQLQDLSIPSDDPAAHRGLRPPRLDAQDGRLRQAHRRVGRPARDRGPPRREAGGPPRPRRVGRRHGRRRGGGGARPGVAPGAPPRRPRRSRPRRWAGSAATPPWRRCAPAWRTAHSQVRTTVLEALGKFPDHPELIADPPARPGEGGEPQRPGRGRPVPRQVQREPQPDRAGAAPGARPAEPSATWSRRRRSRPWRSSTPARRSTRRSASPAGAPRPTAGTTP